MNELTDKWTELEKQRYLVSLSYILNLEDSDNARKKEFMKLKARELDMPLAKIKKVRDCDELVEMLSALSSIRTKRFILRDMILLSTADHDLSDAEISMIYEIGTRIGIRAEKLDDFFLWAARGLEWQIEGSRLVSEDI